MSQLGNSTLSQKHSSKYYKFFHPNIFIWICPHFAIQGNVVKIGDVPTMSFLLDSFPPEKCWYLSIERGAGISYLEYYNFLLPW
jgi:hypothetical protein